MASIHAEIPSNIDVMTIHEIIDTAEREISKKLNLRLETVYIGGGTPTAISAEQLDRIIEFARSRNKGLEVINKAFDYTDNIEQYFGLMCFSKSFINSSFYDMM